MDKKIKFLLIANIVIGLCLGLAAGLIMTLAAWDHNPQEQFSSQPYLLIPIFYSWFSAASTFFFISAFFIKTFKNIDFKKALIITVIFAALSLIHHALFIFYSDAFYLTTALFTTINLLLILYLFAQMLKKWNVIINSKP